MLCSNIGFGTDYPDWAYRGFPQSLYETCRIVKNYLKLTSSVRKICPMSSCYSLIRYSPFYVLLMAQ